MGQYFQIVNLTKREYVNPHGLDCGIKAGEIIFNVMPTKVLGILLFSTDDSRLLGNSCPDGIMGRWCGDSIALVGDESMPKVYEALDDDYTDITAQCREFFERTRYH